MKAVRDLSWLVERPIAHRGLHNELIGIVENSEAAFAAALASNYSIECDIQITADGEAVVFHDDEVERLLDARGPVRSFTARELKRMNFKQGKDRVQTLGELIDQINGRSTLLVEIKSLWDDDFTLTNRAIAVLHSYEDHVALMSFDPALIGHLAEKSESLVRGITADQTTDPYYECVPAAKRLSMRTFSHLPETRPDFISFDFRELPYSPVATFRDAGRPVITWTIRNPAEAESALRWSDQVTFENFLA